MLFVAASLLCGLAPNMTMLIAFRALQGFVAGPMIPLSQSLLLSSYPRALAGLAMAMWAMTTLVAPVMGPLLGGWITDNISWSWIFYINIPVGILAAVMIAAYVHDRADQKRPGGIDYIGIALLVVSVGALQYVLEHGQTEDWFDSRLISSLSVIGLVGGAALLWRELTTAHPVIDFRVLRHRQMWVGTLLGVVMGIGLYAMSFTLPVFLQGNLRMTAEQTGIVLLPGAIATALSMFVVGRFTNRVDPRILLTAGALIFAAAAWRLSLITGESGSGDFFWPLILRGVGLGLMFVPLTTITLAELTPTELPQGTGLYNFFRQLGGSFGIAGIATLLSRYTAQYHAVLAEHVTRLDPMSTGRVEVLTRGMMARGADLWTARARAYQLLEREVMGQASVIAYSRVYVLSAVIILAIIPMLVLVRRTRGAGGSHAVME
jgi:DHA2 family multidrug resistance protein